MSQTITVPPPYWPFGIVPGHGLGVNLDVYTVAALETRQHAVEVLEASLVNPEKT